MPHPESARPARRWLAWAVPGVLILGLGALGTGISNASSGSDAASGVDAAACQALEEQIKAGQEVDAADAIECDQVDFDARADARDAARAQGQNVALENSSICEAVNERAAQFDPRLALELALTCQQRELIVNKVNAAEGLGERELSSLTQGVQAQKARGGQVAPYLEQFCRDEALALADVDLEENAYEDAAEDAYANDEEDYADADANADAYDYEDAARAAEEYAEADDDNDNANAVEVDVDVDIEAGSNGSYDANEVQVDVDVDIDIDSDGGNDNDDRNKNDDEDGNDDEVNTNVKVNVEVK
jgi:hypothetical protein